MTTPRPSRRRRSWNALKSGYHAFSGLLWVAPRTPSLKLGIGVVVVLVALGLLVRLGPVEIAILILAGTVLLAVETLNTAIEMLCDHLHPHHHPTIGKVKDVAAGATAIIEIGGAIVLFLLLAPHLWNWIHR